MKQDGETLRANRDRELQVHRLAAQIGRSACFQNSDPKNAPVPAPNVEVQQGKIEGSNVPVAEAAMRLVGVMRQFEMLQKAVGISSDMDTKTIQEVARVSVPRQLVPAR